MPDYIARLAGALKIEGYASLDLRDNSGDTFVSIEEFTNLARQHYLGAVSEPWNQIVEQIRSLRALGVITVALRAEHAELRLVLVRIAKDGSLSVEEVCDYFEIIERTLRRIESLLPDLDLDDAQKEAVEKAATAFSTAANVPPTPVVAHILTALIKAGRGGDCVSLHPVAGRPSEDWMQNWAAADYTSQPVFGQLWQTQYLWNTADDTFTPCGKSGAESATGRGHHPGTDRLEQLLRATA